MKKLTTIFMALLLTAMGASAQSVSGDYLMMNGGLYLGTGLQDGRQAIMLQKPMYIGFNTSNEAGTRLDTYLYNNGAHYFGHSSSISGVCSCAGTPFYWSVEEQTDGTYTVYCTSSGYEGYLTSNGMQELVTLETTPTEGSYWTLVSKDDVIASMADATEDSPVDVTALINFPDFKTHCSDGDTQPWTTSGTVNIGVSGDDYTGNAAEAWHNAFSISQTITLPLAGTYKLSAQGYHQDDASQASYEIPVLFAGDQTSPLPNINAPTSGTAPSNFSDAADAFVEGIYPVEAITITNKVEGATIKIGFRGDDLYEWVCFSELTLEYYGSDLEIVHACEAEFGDWSISGNTGGSFQRNTWSGEEDASGMVTPFIEYWVGSGNQLSDAVISHKTITGEPDEIYAVSIDYRAFNENSDKKVSQGTTFNANTTSVDLCVGTEAIYNDVSEEEYAVGYTMLCQADEEGNININFTVKDADYDWLAFKDLVVEVFDGTSWPTFTAATGDMHAGYAEAQTAALEAYEAEKTFDTYLAAFTAVNAAHLSALFYADVQEVVDKLDEAGLAKFDELTNSAWSNKTLEYQQDMTDIYIQAQLAQTTPGSDMTYALLNAGEWIGNTGTFQTGVECYGGNSTDFAVGKVLYYNIEGLQAGSYEVTFYAIANAAQWEAGGVTAGSGIAEVFANSTTQSVSVHEQTSCTLSSGLRDLTCTVGTDGVLQFGLQNVATGGNWYVGQALTLTLVELQTDIDWELADVGWGTMIIPFDAEVPSGMTAYAGDAITVNGTSLELSAEAETIEANVPYLVTGTPATYTFSGVPTNTDNAYTVGVLTGTLVDMEYEDFVPGSGQYVLQNHEDGGLAFYQVTTNSAGVKLAANHCYLTYTGAEPTALNLPGMATGIEAVESDVIANDAIYDLSGRRVAKATKGVYIQNGKKVLVK